MLSHGLRRNDGRTPPQNVLCAGPVATRPTAEHRRRLRPRHRSARTRRSRWSLAPVDLSSHARRQCPTGRLRLGYDTRISQSTVFTVTARALLPKRNALHLNANEMRAPTLMAVITVRGLL